MSERTFRDEAGRWWRVREVRAVDPCLLPASYCAGWLTFAGEDGAKRRLAPIPADWDRCSDDTLQALARLARPAPASEELRVLESAEGGGAEARGD